MTQQNSLDNVENNLVVNDDTDAFKANKDDRFNNGVGNQRSKGVNKKAGIAVILLGLLGIGVIAMPNIIQSFKSEKEPVQEEKQTVSTKSYTAPVEEVKAEPKVFSFDEPTVEAPIEKLGEPVKTTEAERPQLVKSLTGGMMPKIGYSTGNDNATDSQNYDKAVSEDQQAVNRAISNANGYLTQPQGGNSPSEKIESSSTSDIFTAPTFQASIARKSQYDPNLLLEQGTLIPCALRVRVISNISGQLSCTITENVYSASGNVLLIDKGSRVNGFYQGNSVQHGSNQLFVVWQEVRTPDHLVIPLNSGSTDELGANGLNGWVDNHFWDRFSNAIFLSMILDGNNILLSKMTDTTAKNSENTREAGKEIATTVLEQMGDIKPTLYKNQGDKVGIFVARDVDFSNVYQLKRSR
ncbi:conjugal transfer protein TrbI [Pasteurellaceae bacterium LFhippo2]|nr:conjugal transfer protein TrbI [Pasteurellaceae bacterium LFhippo2]